jgi:putative ABC transport system permease protein
MQVNRGFDPAQVLTVNVTLPFARYNDKARTIAFVREALARVAALPGVVAAGATSTLPMSGGAATGFVIEGRPPKEDNKEPIADIRSVDANYFRTLAIPLRAGRAFTERDSENAPRVLVINEEMARRHWHWFAGGVGAGAVDGEFVVRRERARSADLCADPAFIGGGRVAGLQFAGPPRDENRSDACLAM